MPQNAAKKTSNDEGRLLLAMNALKKQQITSIHKAARIYCVLKSTLHAQIQGRINHSYKHPKNTKLSENKEITLYDWILSIDKHNYPVRPSIVEQMANCLLIKHNFINLLPTISKN